MTLRLIRAGAIAGLILTGIALLLSQHLLAGGLCYLAGMAIWLDLASPSNLRAMFRRWRRQRRLRETGAAVVATPAIRGAQDRGLGGPFSRLHPAWQDWLAREAASID